MYTYTHTLTHNSIRGHQWISTCINKREREKERERRREREREKEEGKGRREREGRREGESNPDTIINVYNNSTLHTHFTFSLFLK